MVPPFGFLFSLWFPLPFIPRSLQVSITCSDKLTGLYNELTELSMGENENKTVRCPTLVVVMLVAMTTHDHECFYDFMFENTKSIIESGIVARESDTHSLTLFGSGIKIG